MTHEQWFKDFARGGGRLDWYKSVLERFQYADQVRDHDLRAKEKLFLQAEQVEEAVAAERERCAQIVESDSRVHSRTIDEIRSGE